MLGRGAGKFYSTSDLSATDFEKLATKRINIAQHLRPLGGKFIVVGQKQHTVNAAGVPSADILVRMGSLVATNDTCRQTLGGRYRSPAGAYECVSMCALAIRVRVCMHVCVCVCVRARVLWLIQILCRQICAIVPDRVVRPLRRARRSHEVSGDKCDVARRPCFRCFCMTVGCSQGSAAASPSWISPLEGYRFVPGPDVQHRYDRIVAIFARRDTQFC